MSKVFLRRRLFTYIKTDKMWSSQFKAYEEVWQDNCKEVTYWDNGKIYRQRIATKSPNSRLSLFREKKIEDWQKWPETSIYEDFYNLYKDDNNNIGKVKIIPSQLAKKKISGEINEIWQQITTSIAKLVRRVRKAWQAAQQELTRP